MGIMREYKKPVMKVERFTPNNAVAACGVTDTTTYDQQLITCIIDGSEYVFYSGCANNVTSGYLTSYNGNTYFLWYDGKVGTKPDDDDVATLEAIKSAAGATSAIGQSGWHAGIATGTISSIWNSSH